MKTPLVSALLLVGILLGASGCAHVSHTPARQQTRTYALAVSLPDGSALSPEQWAFVKSTMEKSLDAQGAVLVNDITDAAQILRVEFVPDALDPTSGQAIVLNVRANPLYAYGPSRGLALNTSFAFSGVSGPSDLFRYYDSYYGRGYDDYLPPTYISPIGTRPDSKNGGKPLPPRDRPPETERPDHKGDRHADHDHRRRGDRGDRPSRDEGSQRPDRGYARSRPVEGGAPNERPSRRESGSWRERSPGSSDGSRRERSYSRSDSSSDRGYARSEPGSSSSSSSGYSSSSSSSSSGSSSYSSSSSYSEPSSSSGSSFSSDTGASSRGPSIVEAK